MWYAKCVVLSVTSIFWYNVTAAGMLLGTGNFSFYFGFMSFYSHIKVPK